MNARTRYAAVVDCREGSRFNMDTRGAYWEPKFMAVTLAEYDTPSEAMRAAQSAVGASPRDVRNPRVSLRETAVQS